MTADKNKPTPPWRGASYRASGNGAIAEPRNGGDEIKLPVELAKEQNGRAKKSTVQKIPKNNMGCPRGLPVPGLRPRIRFCVFLRKG